MYMHEKRLAAVLMVAVMLMVSLLPLADCTVGQYDADTLYIRDPSDWQYSYRLSVSNNNLTVSEWDSDGKEYRAIENFVSGSGVGNSSFGWDSDGYGPFNSFYAAFDPADGNRMVCHLDPNDLTRSVDGSTVDVTKYNIMWVLPTVYWRVDDGGSLYLTNNSSTGGEAYAHTVDGHVYNYVAIGVYEAYKDDNNVLKSSSGKTPTVSQTRAVFRTQAIANPVTNLDGKAMLWNFYQWELYKYCSYVVMGGFDSQSIVGQGNVNSSAKSDTGAMNSGGAYRGDTADGSTTPVKCFIENAWGSVWEFVDGIVANYDTGMYISQSSQAVDNGTDRQTVPYSKTVTVQKPYVATGSQVQYIKTDDASVWGLATGTDGTRADTKDGVWYADTGDKVLYVGGRWTYGSNAGVSCAASDNVLSSSYATLGARLAFVFDL